MAWSRYIFLAGSLILFASCSAEDPDPMTVGDAGTGGSSSTATTADTAMSGTASSAGSTSTSAASTGEDDSTTTATEATTETGDGESTSADETSGIGGEDNVLYVHVDGQNSNAGTIEAPMRTIQWAISQARRQPQIDTIRVAEGEYAVDYANSDHIVIEDGVSVLGGYSSDWADQDPAQFLTNIVDESEWTPSSESNPHRTVEVPEAVGSDTFVEGLHVGINSGEFRVAILVTGNATIRNNVVEVTMGEVSQHWGIYVTGATPSIIDNRIHFSGNETLATGVDARNSQAVIAGNVVDLSEVVFGATGVRSSVGSNLIAANTIDLGPSGGAVGVRFDSGATPTIDNNLIGSPGQSGTCLRAHLDTSVPVSVRNNLLACQYVLTDNVALLTWQTIAELQVGLATAQDNVKLEPAVVNIDDDLLLGAQSPCSVTRGGLDLSADFAFDRNGVARTAPLSIGAHEWDGRCQSRHR